MHVKNNENGHHMEIGGAADVTIEGCTFTGYTGYRKKEAIQLDCMNNSRVFAGYAPFDDTSCENVVIRIIFSQAFAEVLVLIPPLWVSIIQISLLRATFLRTSTMWQ